MGAASSASSPSCLDDPNRSIAGKARSSGRTGIRTTWHYCAARPAHPEDGTPTMTDRKVPGVEDYDGAAGGWGAMGAVARALKGQMAIGRETAALRRVNQPTGFDCPGCAWPDPKHTSSFEFCENGAKAVSWEATGKRATPEFFAAHPLSELVGMERPRAGRRGTPDPSDGLRPGHATATCRSPGRRPSPASALRCANCRTRTWPSSTLPAALPTKRRSCTS